MEKYLSEVFLETVGMDCTEEKVEKGMKKCEEILDRRLAEIPTQIGKMLYILAADGTSGENPHFREMLDLWDVIKEFADNERFGNFEIVRACRMLGDMYGRKN